MLDDTLFDSASKLLSNLRALDILWLLLIFLCDGNGSVTFTPSGGTSPYEIDKNGSGTFSSSLLFWPYGQC